MGAEATWVLRGLWFLLPLTVGQAVDDALDGAGSGVSNTMLVGLWVVWAIGLAAVAIPLPLSLTAVRMVAPSLVPLTVWSVVVTDASAISIVGLVHGGAAVVVVASHLIGDRFVDGASYGEERRMLLRPPTQLLLTAVPLAWLVSCAGIVAGPLLIADSRWILGVAITAFGVVALAIGSRALHQLSRRWIVFVPNGFVLHDHVALTEPVLFRRTAVERLGPALVGSPARDLSNRAAGLLLECELTDPAPLGLRQAGDDKKAVATMTDVRRFMFAPTRPGALLDEAEGRGLPVD